MLSKPKHLKVCLLLTLSCFLNISLFAQDIFSGNVFLDHNSDALKNGSDYNVPAITIQAYDDTNNNGVFDAGDLLIQSDLTDVSGNYSMTISGAGPTISKNRFVQSSFDDAEEDVSDGSMSRTSSDLEMAFESGSNEQIVGIRFDGIAIPQGVNITNAYIRFQAKANNSGACDLRIWGEKNVASNSFGTSTNNISDRDTTTNFVDWAPSSWSTGNYYDTPDLTAIVNEMTAMPSWSVSSAMTFMITGTGEREPWSYNGSGTEPQLFIEYDNPFTGNRYFIVLDDKEVISGTQITLPGSEYYTYNTSLGTTSNVDFAINGETILCYAMSDGGQNAGLSAMNRATGENFLIGLSGAYNVEAACFDPYSATFYAAEPNQLGTVNRTTGVFSATSSNFGTGGSVSLGANETFNDVDGLAFDPLTGVLWATERKSSWDALFQVDHTTGAHIPDAFGPGEDYVLVRDVGGNMPGDIDDIAIDPENGKLYGIANNPSFDLLVEINKTTGVATPIDTLTKDDGNYVRDVEGFGFTNFGLLLAITGNSSTIDDSKFTVDLEDASVTLVGTYNYGSDYESCDCLTAATNSVSGTVFNDVDGDGQIDVGDSGFQNTTVYFYVDINNDGRIDNGDLLVDSTDTDVNGDWSIVTASNVDMLFTLDIDDLPGGAVLTTNNLEMALFDDAIGGQSDPDNNFGYNFTGPDSDKDGVADINDIDDDNDGIPDIDENYSQDHDGDGTPDVEDADFCTAYFQGVNGWNCANGLPDPSGDLDSDGIVNYLDSSFPNCGGLNSYGVCTNYDKDSDGVPDHLDLDADNDGLPDLIEAGGIDTDGDGRTDNLTDTDADGLMDIFDNNDTDGPSGDGSDPTSPSTSVLIDTDANGITDSGDTDGDGLQDYIDLDADNDGIPDIVEAKGIDSNGDGRVDRMLDDDGDGYSDIYDSDEDDIVGDEDLGTPLVETNGAGSLLDGATASSKDTDNDGLADHIDLDADNDGIPDIVEAGGSTPGADGMVSTTGSWDVDEDGLSDIYDENASDGIGGSGTHGTALVETSSDSNLDYRLNSTEVMQAGGSNLVDADGDNYPNHLDLDADNDGITDVVENAAGDPDADNGGSGDLDGWVANFDDSGDSNGWNDSSTSSTLDTDGDGLPDYLDVDAENDGIPDYIEGVCTTCPTAIPPTGGDSNANGVLDMFENMTSDNTDNISGSHIGTHPNLDDDDLVDSVPDYLDTDSDEDSAFDWSEGFNLTSIDAPINDLITIAANYESANGNPGHYPATDTDSDGIPDWLDNQPSVFGYDEATRPPALDEANAFWRDANNNGLADIFDPLMNGTLATTPDEDAVNDDDWRDNASIIYLPVEIEYFTGESRDCKNYLEWRTRSEDQASFFEIQSSLDGIAFDVVGVVNAKNEPEGASYSFAENASGTFYYYRLKIVDLDGSFEYSDIVAFDSECIEDSKRVKIYPNPAIANNDVINIIPAHLELPTTINLLDLNGRMLKSVSIEQGALNLSIDNLPSGVYFIMGKNGSIPFSERLILQRQ